MTFETQNTSKDTDIFFQVATATSQPHYRGFRITDTPDPAGSLSTGHQPEADPSTPRHTSINAPGGIRTSK